MIAPSYPPGRPATLRRRLLVNGLLPMTLVALALTATVGLLHARILSTETQTVARLQAVRLAGSMAGVTGDDALRDAFARALSRSPPTARLILRRDDATDLIVGSGRPFDPARALHVTIGTPQGELETISDAAALHERRVAGAIMTLLLMVGILAIFILTRRTLQRDIVQPVEALRERLDVFLHPGTRTQPPPADELRAIDGLVDELIGLRDRHDLAMAEALRQRLHDIARHTRFVEQVGDHFRQPLQALALFVATMQCGDDMRQRALQGQMRSSLARLNELLDGLLDMARVDTGAMAPSTVDLCLREPRVVGTRERGV